MLRKTVSAERAVGVEAIARRSFGQSGVRSVRRRGARGFTVPRRRRFAMISPTIALTACTSLRGTPRSLATLSTEGYGVVISVRGRAMKRRYLRGDDDVNVSDVVH